MDELTPLNHLHRRLGELLDTPTVDYRVPGRWIHIDNDPAPVGIHPYRVWYNIIGRILTNPPTPRDTRNQAGGGWSRYATIYNLFVRSGLAFDHDHDGTLGRPNADGFYESGTFVKAICLLPYIKALGCNTIHLLPITKIGRDGNKGDAGSPYAIRNPYELDEDLAEPSLDLGVEAKFAAFVAAAHHLGMRVVLEFVLRTASKDADMVKEHPEWFYWIDASIEDRGADSANESTYGMPIFTKAEITSISEAVKRRAMDKLLPPHPAHRNMFMPVPDPKNVTLHGGKWIATYPDGREGRIPGAFADWPVNDPQPPWGDVTYLRLYDHPDFNYVAYNTIRKYDSRFAQPSNRVEALWEHIVNIIPHYQTNFGIDGAMIDMGHALPMALKQRVINTARSIDPDFAFWDENFDVTQKSVDEGYNAVMGGWPFALAQPAILREMFANIEQNGLPLPMFGAIENHNTPRAISRKGGIAYTRFALAVVAFMPTMPFLHGGLEFSESYPINTGLDFTPRQIDQYPSEQLPLFSIRAFDWAHGDVALTRWWQKTMQLRDKYVDVLTDLRAESFGRLESNNPHIWGILRRTPDWSVKLGLIFNTNMQHPQSVWMPLPTGRGKVMDHFTDTLYDVSNSWAHVQLPAGGVWWLEL